MHRPGAVALRTVHRLVDSRQHKLRFDSLVRTRHIDKAANVIAEYLYLFNTLVGSGLMQLWRAVRRQQDHRHVVHRCLDHRREIVGNGRTRGADERRRTVGGPRVAERVKGRTSLVIVHRCHCIVAFAHGQRQRRAARTGRKAEKCHVLPYQFLYHKIRPVGN